MTILQQNKIENIIAELNALEIKEVSSIELASYCAEVNDNTTLDVYMKVDGFVSDALETYVAAYNFAHKNESGAIFLMIDFNGEDEAKGIPVWQKDCAVAGEVQSV